MCVSVWGGEADAEHQPTLPSNAIMRQLRLHARHNPCSQARGADSYLYHCARAIIAAVVMRTADLELLDEPGAQHVVMRRAVQVKCVVCVWGPTWALQAKPSLCDAAYPRAGKVEFSSGT